MPQNFPALLHAGISPRNRVKELKKIGETHHQISPHIFNMSLQPCFAAWLVLHKNYDLPTLWTDHYEPYLPQARSARYA